MLYAVTFNPQTRMVERCETFSSLLDFNVDTTIIVSTFVEQRSYVKNGQVLPVPTRPNPWLIWNALDETWHDPRLLGDLKDAKWEQVKKWRADALQTPLEWEGYVFDADEKGQANIKGAAQMAQFALFLDQPFSTVFTLADNTSITLDAMQMASVGLALGAKVESCHARSRTLREAVYNAQTSSDLETLQWEET